VSTLAMLFELAEELCDPHVHVERVPYWDASRNKKHREHRTIQPGLLAQLYEAAVEPVKTLQEAGTRDKPKSRAPLAIEAFSRYSEITTAALRWVISIRLAPRNSVESNIRGLVGLAPRFDLDTTEALLQEMRTWRRWAALLTGWQSQVFQPRINCPVCSTPSSIFVNSAEQLAYCGECQHSWEGDDLTSMAERVRTAA
jgi:hypothetical protein